MNPKPPAPMQSVPWDDELTRRLAEHFGPSIQEFSAYQGQGFLVADPDAVVPILEFLKLEEDFEFLVDLTAVDYPNRSERFDLVYILYSFSKNLRIRVKTRIAEGQKPLT